MMLYAAFRLLRPARIKAEDYDESAQARLAALGAETPAHADGVIFAEGGRAGFAFRRFARVWVAEGDPGGPPDAKMSAIWRFRDLCDAHGVAPVFLGVQPEMLPAYDMAGMVPATMEDGRVVAISGEQDPKTVLTVLADGTAVE